MIDLQNRRAFLRAAAAAGVSWVVADVASVEEAWAWALQQTAHPAGQSGAPTLVALTADQATTLDAMTSRILPSVDGRPGAHDAGVIYFIDKALSTFNASQKRRYVSGLRDLDRRAQQQSRTARFATLLPSQQDELLKAIETGAFFQAVRFDTIVGAFALPSWGGNKDYAGWHLLGLDHAPRFQPPFGYYDADVNRSQ